MTKEDILNLAQLVQLGLQKLSDNSQATLNEILSQIEANEPVSENSDQTQPEPENKEDA
jgi:hypothetical protein